MNNNQNNQNEQENNMNMQKIYNLLNNNNNKNINNNDNSINNYSMYTIIHIILYIMIGLGAFYYSYNYVNKGQNMSSKVLISIGAFFMNIFYFIKIIFLYIIGYKWIPEAIINPFILVKTS